MTPYEDFDTELMATSALIDRDPASAVVRARALVEQTPDRPQPLRLLARALRALDQSAEADSVDLLIIDRSSRRPDMVAAIRYLTAGRLREAEALVRRALAADPDDVTAILLLADIAGRVGIYIEAEALLRRASRLAPGFLDAKINLAKILLQQNDIPLALAILDEVLAAQPENMAASAAKLTILGQTGEYEQSIAFHEELLAIRPRDAALWNGYANVLKTVGQGAGSAGALRTAIDIDPTMGESWWGLANLKTARLDLSDVAAMEQILQRPSLDDNRRLHLHFALGKALEERTDYAASFQHYTIGNRLRRRCLPYDADAHTQEIQRSAVFFTADRLHQLESGGAQSSAPIFIVGMPRAGSTLIEQILSSHPQIEGTSELPDIPLLVMRLLAERWQDEHASFPELLDTMPGARLLSLGEEYLRAADVHRKTDRPFFIDKLPNNWAYIGFIHLILPNARIIDARREPMACCLSNFTQHFARGQAFSYDLNDMARYYGDYIRLLDHFDTVLPGRVRRVQHETLIAEPEAEIRALLDDLGLAFASQCLHFHENRRAVRTASAEQVRRPINRDAVDRWRHYLPWLGDLRHALEAEGLGGYMPA